MGPKVLVLGVLNLTLCSFLCSPGDFDRFKSFVSFAKKNFEGLTIYHDVTQTAQVLFPCSKVIAKRLGVLHCPN